MIAEKSQTALNLMQKIGASAPKVGYISDASLSAALLYLENKGFPNNKVEDYKYCNMDAILKREFKSVEQKFNTPKTVKPYALEDTVTLVVLNGQYSADLSDKLILNGLHISAFSSMPAETRARLGSLAEPVSDAFVAFNTAYSADGFYLKVDRGVQINMPVHILYITDTDGEAIVNSRNLIELEEGASITIVEQQLLLGKGKVFTNYLSEKILGANARLNSALYQSEGETGFSVNSTFASLQRDAVYDNTTVTLSGQVVRNNHNVVLAGENSTAHLNGLFSCYGNMLVDNHTLMDHQVPNCESNELYKGIMNDKSTGVFNGKIYVRRDAQKTNAYQSSKNILLSDDATINTKPQLEIYADDVKCSHGTSTGKIDENALFYLNSRGIGKESARKLLLASFAQEVISKIEVESLQKKVGEAFESVTRT